MIVKFAVSSDSIKVLSSMVVSFIIASVTYVIADKIIDKADKVIEKEFIL